MQAPPPPMVTVSKPLNREVTDWDEYTGHLVSPETANIAARISGFIEEAPFKEGALVKKGDVLFVIDDRPFKADLESKQATVAKDEAQVALTKAQLSRSDDLHAKRRRSRSKTTIRARRASTRPTHSSRPIRRRWIPRNSISTGRA